MIRQEFYFCSINNYSVFYAKPNEEPYNDVIYFIIKSDTGASVVIKLSFLVKFDTDFVVIYSLFHQNRSFDAELLGYLCMQLLIEVQHYAKTFDSEIEFSLFDNFYEGIIPAKKDQELWMRYGN